ncbi:polyphosphate kinase [uncultured Porticoccus sp.]|uniref:polyphosphate kinase 2 family protein n=1 Tax=uncultured Porticoccus sp. TaxID=1256050 RepID=UPI002627C307|nr:polyphosphate kinase [uncultured Porticoccus sp.]
MRASIDPVGDGIQLSDVDPDQALRDKDEYKHLLGKLQEKMLQIQLAYYTQGRRAVIVLEGADCAGKGGIIRRLTQPLDVRGVQVWPVGAPSEEELRQHYLQRFWQRLPSSGSIAIFDRSWYGRVLVERIEGYCSKSAWQRAYAEINDFERMLHDDGVPVVKLLPVISKTEQMRRFEERLRNPRKQWKITSEDIRNWHHWDDYQQAFQEMLDKTSTDFAPWHLIPGNRKWFARVEALKVVTEVLARGVDISVPLLEPELMQEALEMLRRELKDS